MNAPLRMTAAPSMLEHALKLAARGFYVFPIRQGQKAPPRKGWQTLATRDAEAIAELWRDQPADNVGIDTSRYGDEGKALLALDVDRRDGKDGAASLKALAAGRVLPDTYTQDTPSGGMHFVFTCDAPGVKLSAGKLGVGLDVRSRGGYIVAAGSSTGEGEYTGDDDKVAAAPAWLADLCTRAPEKEEKPAAPAIPTNQDSAQEWAEEYLQSLGVVPEGGRNHKLNEAGARIREKGLARDRAQPLLQAWGESQGLTAEETAATIRSVYTSPRIIEGGASPEADFGPATGDAPAAQPKAKRLRTVADIDGAGLLRPDYLIKGWLDRGSDALLVGEWNAGKTFLGLNLAVHIAAGLRWFGARVKQAGALYMGYEGGRGLDKRVSALQQQLPGVDWPRLPFAWQMLSYPLTTKQGREELDGAIHEFHARFGAVPGLVVIDPLKDALGGDDSDAALVGELNQTVKTMMRVHGCSVLRMHHTGHADKTRGRGHSSLPASADTTLLVADGVISATKQRDEAKGSLTFKLEVVTLGTDADGDPVTTCIVQPVNPGAGRDFGGVKSKLKARGNASKALRILTELIAAEKTKNPAAIFDATVPEHRWREVYGEQNRKLTNDAIRMGFSRARQELCSGNHVEIINGNAGLL